MSKSNKIQAREAITRKSPHRSRLQTKKPDHKATQAHVIEASAKPAVRKASKLSSVITMLQGPKGASIAQLCKATGWQAHSVRGAISGTIKKRLALEVTSEKSDGVRIYRIAN